MSRHAMRGGAVAAAALALAALPAAPSHASSQTNTSSLLSLAPARGHSGNVLLKSHAGTVLKTAVRVTNQGSTPVVALVRPADLGSGTAGGLDYRTNPRATGRWVQLERTAVRLAPHQTRRIAVTVNVPSALNAGSYYAGVVAEPAPRSSAGHASTVAARTARIAINRVVRVAVPLTVSLPGARVHKLQLDELKLGADPSGPALTLPLRNTGNTLIDGAKVDVTVSRDGRTLFRHRAPLSYLMPDSPVGYRVPWRGKPMRGDYQVTGTIKPKDAPAVRINQTVTFTDTVAKKLKQATGTVVSPEAKSSTPTWMWGALGIAGTLIAGFAVAFMRLRRRLAPTR